MIPTWTSRENGFCDASDLSIMPGDWPHTLTVVGPGGAKVTLIRADKVNKGGELQAVLYKEGSDASLAEANRITLTVFND